MPYSIELRKQAFTAISINHLLPAPHIHSHLEWIYLEEGASVACVDGKTYEIEAGSVFMSFPNQIHFYQDRSPVKGTMIIFSPDFFPELTELFQNKTPFNPIISHSLLPGDIAIQLEKICAAVADTSFYGSIRAKGLFLALLGQILPCYSYMVNPGSQDSIKNILLYCMEHYAKPLSLEILAKDLHLNKFYISHVFSERMDISFKDFVNRLRVDDACALLEKTENSITDIAYCCGFSTIRTFNRAFRKFKNMTPGEYLWLIKNQK